MVSPSMKQDRAGKLDRFDDAREAVSEIIAVAGVEPHAAASTVRQDAL
jgi:hypothetical protein